MKISTKLFLGFFCIILGLVGISINLSINTKHFSEKALEINQNIEILKNISNENVKVKDIQDSFITLYSTVSEYPYVKNIENLNKLNKRFESDVKNIYDTSSYLDLQKTLQIAIETLNKNLKKFTDLKLSYLELSKEIENYNKIIKLSIQNNNIKISLENINKKEKLEKNYTQLSKEIENLYLGKIVANLETVHNSLSPYINKKNNQNIWTINSVKTITLENSKLISKTKKRNTMYIGIILIFSVLVLFITIRSIQKPIKNLTLIGEKLANLDLTVMFKKKYSKNEIGILNQSFKGMVKALKKTIFDIKEISSTVKIESENISSSVMKTAATTQELSTSINNITNSIEESFTGLSHIDKKVKSISDNSASILDTVKLIKENNEIVLEGTKDEKDNLFKTLEKVNLVANDIRNNSKQINELKTLSEEIHQFIKKIYSVTEQTNLLALNAAIEASRAGEAGKGFAVVADEIRKLANDSRETAEEIEEKINHISEKIDLSVRTSNLNKEKLDQTTEEITEVSETIEGIVNAFEELTMELNTIYGGIEGQSNDLEYLLNNSNEMTESFKEIDTGIKKIDKSVSFTAQIINSLGDGAQGLTKTSDKLNEMLHMFKS